MYARILMVITMKRLIKIMMCVLLLSGCSNSTDINKSTINELGCVVEDASTLKTYDKFSNVNLSGFDTYIQLIAYVPSASEFAEYWNIVVENWEHYDKLFDKYDTFEDVNNIKTINDNAGIKPVEVEADLMELILLSKEYYEITNGAFDITLGPVLEIWHNYREEGQALNEQGLDGNLPTQAELEEANKYVGWQYVEIDEENSTIYLTHPKASLDVGGVAKGFAAEKIARQLECAGVVSALLDAGGNIRAIGHNPNGNPWTVGVSNPNDFSNSLSYEATQYSESMSFVTSGDYLRYYMVDGKRYSHLVSPYTLWPAENFRSVYINVPNSALADIYSTALFVLDYESGLELSNNRNFGAIWIVDEENSFEAEYSDIMDYSEDVKPVQLVANKYALEHTVMMKEKY